MLPLTLPYSEKGFNKNDFVYVILIEILRDFLVFPIQLETQSETRLNSHRYIINFCVNLQPRT